MRKHLLILALALIPALASAQDFVRNNTATTTINPENLRPGRAAVTSTGELFCSASGGATSLGKAEDAAHTTADTGVMALGVRNTGFATLADTTLDYSPIATNAFGAVYCAIDQQATSSNTSPVRVEDSTIGDGHGLMIAGSSREDTISVDANANTDAQPLKSDKFGRLLVSESVDAQLFNCNSASDVTDTNAADVCAADADELFNIHSITCSNTDATVATRVDILDDAAVIWQCVLTGIDKSATTCSQTFPSPLKQAAINKAIKVQAATTSAQIRCSISGFKTPS